MRKINERFIHDLKSGCLSFFLERVKTNRQELCLEIRDGNTKIKNNGCETEYAFGYVNGEQRQTDYR